MYRYKPSLEPKETTWTTWIAQKRHAGQVEYFQIINPIETQQLLHETIKVLLHGYKYKMQLGIGFSI